MTVTASRFAHPTRRHAVVAAAAAFTLLAPLVAAVDSPRSASAPAAGDARSVGLSVRPRGEAAPVTLRATPTPPPAPTPPDGGDAAGARQRVATRDEDRDVEDARRDNDRARQPSRVWPLEKGSYSFTQAFGCVPQLGGFYGVDPGCPDEAPAVHGGIDLAAAEGVRILAAASGWVTEAGLDRDTGLANTRIVIQHDDANEGYATEYLHWSATFVRPGDYVRAGEPIAEVGSVGWSTGPHLHFAVIAFATGDYLDPVEWLPNRASGGAHEGIEPRRRPIRFEGRSVNLPDYADPAPPAPPRRERVPAAPPADDGAESTDDSSSEKDARDQRQRRIDRRDRDGAERAEADSGGEDQAEAETDGAASDDGATDGKRRNKPRREGEGTEVVDDGGNDDDAAPIEDETAEDPKVKDRDRPRDAENDRGARGDGKGGRGDGGRDRDDNDGNGNGGKDGSGRGNGNGGRGDGNGNGNGNGGDSGNGGNGNGGRGDQHGGGGRGSGEGAGKAKDKNTVRSEEGDEVPIAEESPVPAEPTPEPSAS